MVVWIQICGLLAHLLFLRANGGTEYATALSDTFGSHSFVAAAMVTQVPDEFIQDIQELYPKDRQIQKGVMLCHSCCALFWMRLPYIAFGCQCMHRRAAFSQKCSCMTATRFPPPLPFLGL